MFEIKVTGNKTADLKKFSQDIAEIIDDEILNLADQLQQQSPIGATLELKKGWDVKPSEITPNSVKAAVLNKAPNALQRIAGKKAGGRFEDYKPGSDIAKWAILKGIPAFLVARKIFRFGTDRYISGENIAGIDKDTGKILEGGAIAQAARRIRFRLKKIKIGRK
jgi:hypothetical protein